MAQYNGSNSMPLRLQWTNPTGQTIASDTTNSSTSFQSYIVIQVTSADIFPLNCTTTFSSPTYQTVPGITQAKNIPSVDMLKVTGSFSIRIIGPSTSLVAISTTQLKVVWLTSSANVTHYLIQCYNPVVYIQVPVNVGFYQLDNLLPGTSYTVYVSACDSSTCAADVRTQLTNNTFPATPEDLTQLNSTSTTLTVSWTQIGSADSYIVYVNFNVTSTVTLSDVGSERVTCQISQLSATINTYCLSIVASSGNLTSLPANSCMFTTADGSSGVSPTTTAVIILSVLLGAALAAVGLLLWLLLRQGFLPCPFESNASHNKSSSAATAAAGDETTRQRRDNFYPPQQYHKQSTDSAVYVDNMNRPSGVYEELHDSNSTTTNLYTVNVSFT
jgi:hypothetical protein